MNEDAKKKLLKDVQLWNCALMELRRVFIPVFDGASAAIEEWAAAVSAVVNETYHLTSRIAILVSLPTLPASRVQIIVGGSLVVLTAVIALLT